MKSKSFSKKSEATRQKRATSRSFLRKHAPLITSLLFTANAISGQAEYIGQNAGSNEVKTVSDLWENTSQLYIGYSGTGTLNITPTGRVASSWSYMGYNAGSSGSANVSGTWSSSDSLFIGRAGTGTLTINGGSVSNATSYLGYSSTGNGTAIVNSGTWSSTYGLHVGFEGTGVLTLNSGYVFSGYGYLGDRESSHGTATIRGSWINSDRLYVGSAGTGSLIIDGGYVANTGGYIGNKSTGHGTVTVTSGTWINSGDLDIGSEGTGSLTINGGYVSNAYANIGTIQTYSSHGRGTVTVNSGTWNNSGYLYVGREGTGTLAINGGYVSNAVGYIGYWKDQTAPLSSNGTVTVNSGTWNNSGNLYVSYQGGGTLTIENGGYVSNVTGYIGYDRWTGNGGVTVKSGTWHNSGNLSIGYLGRGTLTIDGGHVSNATGYIGDDSRASGTVTITSGTWSNTGNLYVGNSGTGTLVINGGYVSNATAYLGYYSQPAYSYYGTGNVTVTSGTWSNAGDLYIARDGAATLTIGEGGYVSNATGYISSTRYRSGGNAIITGGTWNNSGNLYIGHTGAGGVTVNGGLLRVGGTTFLSYSSADSGGMLTLSATNGRHAVLETSRIMKGAGPGDFYIDGGIVRALANESNFISNFHAGNVLIHGGGAYIDTNGYNIGITSSLGGSGVLIKQGEGNLTLSASNSYSGGTLIESGTLTVAQNATLGSGNVNISNGALTISGGKVSSAISWVGSTSTGTGSATVTSGSWSTSESLYVGVNTIGALTINGGHVAGANSYLGVGSTAHGSAVVTGGTWSHSGNLYVGTTGSGALAIDGGHVSGSNSYLGVDSMAHGSATVSSGTWSNASSLYVGHTGTGSLLINGGHVSNENGYIAHGSTSRGTATVSSGTWSNANDLYIGHAGSGSLLINGGSVLSGTSYIGFASGGYGAATVTGGSWKNSGNLYIGYHTGGALSINGGSVFSESGYIGYDEGGNGNVTVTSGTWTNSNNLHVGYNGSGTLTINGGYVSNAAGYIGGNSYSTATVSGGVWSNSGNLYIGYNAGGALTINGGRVHVDGQTILGLNEFVNGTINLTGSEGNRGVLETGSIVKGNGSFGTATLNIDGGILRAVRNENEFMRFYPGEVTIQAGGAYIDTNGFDINIGSSLTGEGMLIKLGEGNLTLSASNRVGTVIEAGTLTVAQHGTIGYSGLIINNGTLAVDGGNVNSLAAFLGYNAATDHSHAVITRGIWTSYALVAGYTGTGTITVNGGYLDSSEAYIGGAGHGGITVTNGTWNSVNLYVGGADTGTVAVNGGYVSSVNAYIGYLTGHGTVTVTGGTWNNSGSLFIGNDGPGALAINGGLVRVSETTHVGYQATASGTMTLSGSGGNRGVLETNQILKGSGSGGVNFDGGIVRAQRSESNFIANFQPGNVTIQSGGAYIDTNGYNIGISSSLSGSGQLTKLGAGILTLSGSHSHTGEVSVDQGLLRVSGTLSSSRVTVNDGGTLGGTGYANEVILNENGIIAPGNSVGTLHTGSQIWNEGSTYLWEVESLTDSPKWDLLEIDGTLTLNPGEGNISILVSSLNLDTESLQLNTPYLFTIATTTGGIVGFDENAFTINTHTFGSNLGELGQFSIALSDDGLGLDLIYIAVPEPGTLTLAIAGSLLALSVFRRMRKS